jgi:hypothetical protein
MKLIDMAIQFHVTCENSGSPTPLINKQRWTTYHQQIEKDISNISHAIWSGGATDDITLAIADCMYTLAVVACEAGKQHELEACFAKLHQQKMSALPGKD